MAAEAAETEAVEIEAGDEPSSTAVPGADRADHSVEAVAEESEELARVSVRGNVRDWYLQAGERNLRSRSGEVPAGKYVLRVKFGKGKGFKKRLDLQPGEQSEWACSPSRSTCNPVGERGQRKRKY